MARDVYYVARHGPHWQINHGDRQHGPYGSQCAAIMVAITAAHRAGQTNSDGAQVLVQGENNQFRAEWTYGNDPYPPKGVG